MGSASVYGAIGLALILGAAVVGTLLDPLRFDAIVRSQRMPSSVGAMAVATEGALILALATSPRLGGAGAAAYLVVLTGFFAVRRLAGDGNLDDCGCFARPHPVDVVFFARNSALIATAVWLAGWGRAGAPAVAVVAGLSGFLLCARLYWSRLAVPYRDDGSPDRLQRTEGT